MTGQAPAPQRWYGGCTMGDNSDFFYFTFYDSFHFSIFTRFLLLQQRDRVYLYITERFFY
jgi:hypothetical protein